MSAIGGVPRFSPDVQVNFRSLPTFNPQAQNAAMNFLDGAGQVFDQIASAANQLHKQRVENEALQAGQTAGAEKGFDANSLPQDMTVASQAYRKGALQTYSSQLELARDKAFNQFQMDYMQTPEDQQDPAKLQSRFQAWIEGTASTLPENMRPGFTQLAMDKANPIIMNANQNFLASQQQNAAKNTQALLEVTKRNIQDIGFPQNEADHKALDTYIIQGVKAIQSMDLPEEEKKLKLDEFQQFTRESAILGGFNAAPDKMAYFEKFTTMSPQDVGLPSLDAKNKLASTMQAHLQDEDYITRKHQQELTRDQKLSLAMQKQTFEDRIHNGDPNLNASELVKFYQDNETVGPDWLASQLSNLSKLRQGQQDEAKAMSDLSSGKVPFDPSDAKTQKLLNKIYQQGVGQDATGGATLPVSGATVTSGFGPRVAPTAGASTNHPGVDYGAPAGTPIRPSLGGKVVYSGQMRGYGNVVDVLQEDGYTVRYAHNSQNLVQKGAQVQPGQTVALVGATGNATGPHTHIEVRDPSGKLVDPSGYFGKQVASKPLSDEDRQRFTAAFIKKYRFIPDTYRNETIGMLHGNPQQVAQAAGRIAFLQDNGVDTDGFGKADAAFALRVAEDMRRGIDPTKAVEMARFALDPANQNLIEGNRKRVKDALKRPENQPDHLFDNGGFFGIGVNSPVANATGGVLDNFRSDWNKAFTDAYLNTGGHEDAARNVASQQMKKTWGVTSVDGSQRLIKYPPEQFYKIYGGTQDTNWIKKQLFDDLSGHTLRSKPLADGDVYLVSDTQTAREASKGRPSYMVLVRDSRGVFMPLVQNNKVQRFLPDPGRVIDKIKADQAHKEQQAMQQAQAARQEAIHHKPAPYHFNMIGK